MIDVRIIGPEGTAANVSPLGQLAVGVIAHNLTVFNELGTDDAGVTFYKPKSGKQFIVTHVFAFGDKQITTTNATVEVFESLAEDSATVEKTLLKFEIGQDSFQAYSLINIIVNSNRFINAKTDNDDVHMNILGYYIDKVE